MLCPHTGKPITQAEAKKRLAHLDHVAILLFLKMAEHEYDWYRLLAITQHVEKLLEEGNWPQA